LSVIAQKTTIPYQPCLKLFTVYYISETISTMSAASTETKTPPTFGEIMDKAAKSALRGGTAGAVAMGLNVGALMWMRTTVRYEID
jgi:hypothetical protein